MIDSSLAQRVVDAIFPGMMVKNVLHFEGSPNVETVHVRLGPTSAEAAGAAPAVVGAPPAVVLRRQARPLLQRQASVLEAIADRFPPAPRCYGLVDLDRGDPSESILVLEYREGCVDVTPKDALAYAEGLAVTLSRLHSLDGPYPNEVPRRRPLRSDDTTNSLVLLHGDYWPGNVLWRPHRPSYSPEIRVSAAAPVAVIDWEDVEAGDPLVDISRTRSELAWLFGYEVAEEFAAAYEGRRSIDWSGLGRYDCEAGNRIVRIMAGDYVATARFAGRLGRDDLTPRIIEDRVLMYLRRSADAR